MRCGLNLVFVLAILLGCANNVHFPGPEFSGSEPTGMGKLKAGLGAGQGYRSQVTDSIGGQPFVENPDIEDATVAMLSGSVGIMPFLDAEFAFGPQIPAYLGLKIAPVGDSLGSAKQGNFSVGIRVGGGVYAFAKTVLSDDETEERGYILSGFYTSVEALAGFRPLGLWNIYVGYGLKTIGTSLEFTKGAEGKFNMDGRIRSLILGNQFSSGTTIITVVIVKQNALVKQKPDEDLDGIKAGLEFGLIF